MCYGASTIALTDMTDYSFFVCVCVCVCVCVRACACVRDCVFVKLSSRYLPPPSGQETLVATPYAVMPRDVINMSTNMIIACFPHLKKLVQMNECSNPDACTRWYVLDIDLQEPVGRLRLVDKS